MPCYVVEFAAKLDSGKTRYIIRLDEEGRYLLQEKDPFGNPFWVYADTDFYPYATRALARWFRDGLLVDPAKENHAE